MMEDNLISDREWFNEKLLMGALHEAGHHCMSEYFGVPAVSYLNFGEGTYVSGKCHMDMTRFNQYELELVGMGGLLSEAFAHDCSPHDAAFTVYAGWESFNDSDSRAFLPGWINRLKEAANLVELLEDKIMEKAQELMDGVIHPLKD